MHSIIDVQKSFIRNNYYNHRSMIKVASGFALYLYVINNESTINRKKNACS